MEEEDEEVQIQEESRKSPFFNFADASLKRIDAVLLQFGITSISFDYSDLLIQKRKIALVKILLQFSIPLAPDLFSDEFKEEILNIRINKQKMIRNGNQKILEVYNEELDEKLDNYIIQISLKLQSKGFFMPSPKDDDDDDY